MTTKQALKLIPEKSYIRLARGKYRVSSVGMMYGVCMIEIYDAPPSHHTDLIKAENCEKIYKPRL
jgi:hypothetical protein